MSKPISSINVQVDADVKLRAAAALDDIGLSMSDAVRIFLHRIAEDRQFPWELKVPNAETQAAMAEARAAINRRALDETADVPPGAHEKAA